MKSLNQTLNILQSKINLLLCICVLFYSSFVHISAYANVYLKTTIIKQNMTIIIIAGVPSSQGLPYYCTPPLCVPAVLGALAVWRYNETKKKLLKRVGSAYYLQMGLIMIARFHERGVAGSQPSTRGRSPMVLEVLFHSRALFKAEIQIEIVLGYLHYLELCTV